jgi:FkbM family methyltransferase
MLRARDFAKRVLPLPMVARLTFFRELLATGEWELRELAHLASAPGLALDVGANIGLYSYALKRLGRDVVSFEPDPAYQERLRALLGNHARIESVALSDRQGIGIMRVPQVRDGYGGARGSLNSRAVPSHSVSMQYEAELRTLDSYDLGNVGFIKIDVEGHEESVLGGAQTTLRRSKPVLLIEIEERHNPGGIDRISNSLSRLGYAGSFFFERKRYCLSAFDPDRHQRREHFEALEVNRRQLPYVNNFIFSVR